MEVPALMEAMMKPARLKMPARLESSADPKLLVPALCAPQPLIENLQPTLSACRPLMSVGLSLTRSRATFA